MLAGPSPSEPAAALPERVVGQYRLIRRLGRGGMGEVWLGRHVKTQAVAAVKVLRESHRPRERVLELFERERLAVSRLRHPHIVALYEVGPDYLVTAYIDGFDLARRLHTPIDPATAVYLTLQIASALAHAHAHGVVHRDVKPSNILLDGQGNAYLTDFGLALLPDADTAAPRAGTPGFMAPEQISGESVGPAADQYALGRTLLEMLAGGSVSPDPRQALAQLPAGLPAALRQAVRRATEPDPAKRWPSIDAFGEALAAIDLRDYPPPVRLAPEVRVRTPFTWAGGALASAQVAPDIGRADFRLSALERAGLLPAGTLARFAERTGYGDFGWSVYGRQSRLGQVTSAAAFARASDMVVLMHGLLCRRDIWEPIAAAAVRDNAQALVLVPDLLGFGDSPFASPKPAPEHASPVGLMRTILEWVTLLGVRDLPTVLVGHSVGAVALMSVGDGDMGLKTQRIAVSPVFPSIHGALRWKMRIGALLLSTLGRFPPVKRWLGRKLVLEAPEVRPYALPDRERMLRNFLGADARTLSALARAYAKAVPAPPERLTRCTVVLGEDDPLTPTPVIRRALAAFRMRPENVHYIQGYGHMPHAERSENPGLTARNLGQLVQLVNALLVSSREGTLLSTEVASTELSTGSGTSAG